MDTAPAHHLPARDLLSDSALSLTPMSASDQDDRSALDALLLLATGRADTSVPPTIDEDVEADVDTDTGAGTTDAGTTEAEAEADAETGMDVDVPEVPMNANEHRASSVDAPSPRRLRTPSPDRAADSVPNNGDVNGNKDNNNGEGENDGDDSNTDDKNGADADADEYGRHRRSPQQSTGGAAAEGDDESAPAAPNAERARMERHGSRQSPASPAHGPVRGYDSYTGSASGYRGDDGGRGGGSRSQSPSDSRGGGTGPRPTVASATSTGATSTCALTRNKPAMPANCRVICCNLPLEYDDEDLVKLGQRIGEVVGVKTFHSKAARASATGRIEFATPALAARARQELTGVYLDDRRLGVREDREAVPDSANLGGYQRFDGSASGGSYDSFSGGARRGRSRSRDRFSGGDGGGGQWRDRISSPDTHSRGRLPLDRRVEIGHIPGEMRDHDILQHFSAVGECRVVHRNIHRRMVVLEYETGPSAQLCIQRFDGARWLESTLTARQDRGPLDSLGFVAKRTTQAPLPFRADRSYSPQPQQQQRHNPDGRPHTGGGYVRSQGSYQDDRGSGGGSRQGYGGGHGYGGGQAYGGRGGFNGGSGGGSTGFRGRNSYRGVSPPPPPMSSSGGGGGGGRHGGGQWGNSDHGRGGGDDGYDNNGSGGRAEPYGGREYDRSYDAGHTYRGGAGGGGGGTGRDGYDHHRGSGHHGGNGRFDRGGYRSESRDYGSPAQQQQQHHHRSGYGGGGGGGSGIGSPGQYGGRGGGTGWSNSDSDWRNNNNGGGGRGGSSSAHRSSRSRDRRDRPSTHGIGPTSGSGAPDVGGPGSQPSGGDLASLASSLGLVPIGAAAPQSAHGFAAPALLPGIAGPPPPSTGYGGAGYPMMDPYGGYMGAPSQQQHQSTTGPMDTGYGYGGGASYMGYGQPLPQQHSHQDMARLMQQQQYGYGPAHGSGVVPSPQMQQPPHP
ncbi:hypothetical protein BC828DRAFT_280048 [Blastocladiella britannica]|nr:hypothetical protein BC828DRAFT_280048 [Blastocladiella britannica]